MSITLSVKADDAEVESLLAFLDAHIAATPEHKIWVLKRAVKWIEAALPTSYDVARAETHLHLHPDRQPLPAPIENVTVY